jgi:hypothetical protein
VIFQAWETRVAHGRKQKDLGCGVVVVSRWGSLMSRCGLHLAVRRSGSAKGDPMEPWLDVFHGLELVRSR